MCTCHVYMSYAHVICTCHMYMSYVHVICTCHMYMSYVHDICTCDSWYMWSIKQLRTTSFCWRTMMLEAASTEVEAAKLKYELQKRGLHVVDSHQFYWNKIFLFTVYYYNSSSWTRWPDEFVKKLSIDFTLEKVAQKLGVCTFVIWKNAQSKQSPNWRMRWRARASIEIFLLFLNLCTTLCTYR
jgi:hypothetical protein